MECRDYSNLLFYRDFTVLWIPSLIARINAELFKLLRTFTLAPFSISSCTTVSDPVIRRNISKTFSVLSTLSCKLASTPNILYFLIHVFTNIVDVFTRLAFWKDSTVVWSLNKYTKCDDSLTWLIFIQSLDFQFNFCTLMIGVQSSKIYHLFQRPLVKPYCRFHP